MSSSRPLTEADILAGVSPMSSSSASNHTHTSSSSSGNSAADVLSAVRQRAQARVLGGVVVDSSRNNAGGGGGAASERGLGGGSASSGDILDVLNRAKVAPTTSGQPAAAAAAAGLSPMDFFRPARVSASLPAGNTHKVVEDIPVAEPSSDLKDKINFLINNINNGNIEHTVKEFKSETEQDGKKFPPIEPKFYNYFSRDLVRTRIAHQPNYHDVFYDLVKAFKERTLDEGLRRETVAEAKNLTTRIETDIRNGIRNTSTHERTTKLKNVGSFLGRITFGQGVTTMTTSVGATTEDDDNTDPALQFDLKYIIIEALRTGTLFAIVPFVMELLKHCVTLTYKPVNGDDAELAELTDRTYNIKWRKEPSVLHTLAHLHEMYQLPDIDLRLQCLVEELCRTLGMGRQSAEERKTSQLPALASTLQQSATKTILTKYRHEMASIDSLLLPNFEKYVNVSDSHDFKRAGAAAATSDAAAAAARTSAASAASSSFEGGMGGSAEGNAGSGSGNWSATADRQSSNAFFGLDGSGGGGGQLNDADDELLGGLEDDDEDLSGGGFRDDTALSSGGAGGMADGSGMRVSGSNSSSNNNIMDLLNKNPLTTTYSNPASLSDTAVLAPAPPVGAYPPNPLSVTVGQQSVIGNNNNAPANHRNAPLPDLSLLTPAQRQVILLQAEAERQRQVPSTSTPSSTPQLPLPPPPPEAGLSASYLAVLGQLTMDNHALKQRAEAAEQNLIQAKHLLKQEKKLLQAENDELQKELIVALEQQQQQQQHVRPNPSAAAGNANNDNILSADMKQKLDELKAELRYWEGRCKMERDENFTLSQKVTQLEKENADQHVGRNDLEMYERRIKTIEGEKVNLERQNESLQERINVLIVDKTKLEDTGKDWQLELKEQKDTYEREKEALEKEKAQQEQGKKQRNKEIEGLKTQKTALEKRIADQDNALTQRKKNEDALKVKLNGEVQMTSKLQADIKKLVKEAERLKATIRDFERMNHNNKNSQQQSAGTTTSVSVPSSPTSNNSGPASPSSKSDKNNNDNSNNIDIKTAAKETSTPASPSAPASPSSPGTANNNSSNDTSSQRQTSPTTMTTTSASTVHNQNQQQQQTQSDAVASDADDADFIPFFNDSCTTGWGACQLDSETMKDLVISAASDDAFETISAPYEMRAFCEKYLISTTYMGGNRALLPPGAGAGVSTSPTSTSSTAAGGTGAAAGPGTVVIPECFLRSGTSRMFPKVMLQSDADYWPWPSVNLLPMLGLNASTTSPATTAERLQALQRTCINAMQQQWFCEVWRTPLPSAATTSRRHLLCDVPCQYVAAETESGGASADDGSKKK